MILYNHFLLFLLMIFHVTETPKICQFFSIFTRGGSKIAKMSKNITKRQEKHSCTRGRKSGIATKNQFFSIFTHSQNSRIAKISPKKQNDKINSRARESESQESRQKNQLFFRTFTHSQNAKIVL